MAVRFKRLADELRIRRRRVTALRNSPPFPGKGPTQAREESQYDHCLVVAARMLEVPVPAEAPSPGRPLSPEARAVLEDRLAHAGLDVFAPRWDLPDADRDDSDPVF